jgi:small subunit ribosomal protein S7
MRSKPPPNRNIQPDPVYADLYITKLINRTMRSGKKTAATRQVYQALDLIKAQTGEDPLTVFHAALENIRPQMEVRARRIGGAAYQVPNPVRGPRKDSLAIRWLLLAASARSNSQYHSFGAKLAAEILEAKNQAGAAVKKKLDTHRMAEANKAFAHFRW